MKKALFLMVACVATMLTACTEDNSDKSVHLTVDFPDVPTDTEEEPGPTEAPQDVPDVLRIDFMTVFGPSGMLEASPGQRVNMGGFKFTNYGDEIVWIEEMNLPLLADTVDDAYRQFGMAGWGRVLENCSLEKWGTGQTMAGPIEQSMSQWYSRLYFIDDFGVEPGTENALFVNLMCDIPADLMLAYRMEIAIEVPLESSGNLMTSADEVEYGNFNGLPPSRTTLLPYDRYPAECDRNDGFMASDETWGYPTDANPFAYWDVHGMGTYPNVPSGVHHVTMHLDAGSCNPYFYIDAVSLRIVSTDSDRPLVGVNQSTGVLDDGAYTRLIVNGGQSTDVFTQGVPTYTPWNTHGYTWSWKAVNSVGWGYISNQLPVTGSCDITFEIDPSVFDAQLSGPENLPLALLVDAWVVYRDVTNGALFTVAPSTYVLTINW